MVNSRTIRMPEDLAIKIEKDAIAQNIPSENEYIVKALEHFLKCKKAETVQRMKQIVFRYVAKCLKCGRQIEVGEWGLWGRDVGAICIDCYIKRYGDKTALHQYMKLKEIKWMIKVGTTELDKITEKLKDFSFYEIIQEIHIGYQEIHKRFEEWKAITEDEQEKQKATEILEHLRQNWDTLNKAHDFMMIAKRKRKKKKKVTQ